jgi:hypothetical protein
MRGGYSTLVSINGLRGRAYEKTPLHCCSGVLAFKPQLA